MKLFFLLISFLCINCLPDCLHQKEAKKIAVAQKPVSYEIVPSAILY